MVITDSVADMLNRIRNAGRAGHASCDIPASKLKEAIANILLEEGYIKSVKKIEDGPQGTLRVEVKYQGSRPVISGIRRISKPGLRVYSNAKEMPRVLGGLGIAIVSTSKGVMTDRNARAAKVGGEVLAYIW